MENPKKVTKIDLWWNRTVDHRRIDRGPYYVSCTVGLFLTSLSMLVYGPVPGSSVDRTLSNLEHISLAVILMLGSSCCIFGLAAGSRWFFPHITRRTSYMWGIAGNPASIGSLLVYSSTVFSASVNASSAIGSVLTLMLMIGSAWNACYLILEIRRISRNLIILKEKKYGDKLG